MSGDSIVERVAIALHGSGILAPPPDHSWTECVVKDEFRRAARAVIEAMREPAVLEAACRAAADLRTGYICWEGISVHRAADVVDAVLGGALTEK